MLSIRFYLVHVLEASGGVMMKGRRLAVTHSQDIAFGIYGSSRIGSSTWTPNVGNIIAPNPEKSQKEHHSTYFWASDLQIKKIRWTALQHLGLMGLLKV